MDSTSTATSGVVIVGAGAAGEAAAITARKHGFEGRVVLVSADVHRPYERPYLSKQFLKDEMPLERVFLRSTEEYKRQDIELMLGSQVVSASRRERAVELADGRRIHFDRLVLATGGTPRQLPGVPPLSNVYTLRTLSDSEAIKRALGQSERLLVVGAGFIGAEVAASARALGKDVLMIEVAPVPLGRALGQEMGEVYARIHRSHGVDLRTGTSVTRWLSVRDRVVGVELGDGSREEVDGALIAVGIEPTVDLASDLGLALGFGGILVDETLQAAPDVFCAGDIAAHLHPVYGRHLRVEHWQVAQRQGAACGAAIVAGAKPYEELPWFWSDQYDVNLQYVGHAQDFDQIVWRGDRESDRFAVFYLKESVIDAVLTINDGRTGRRSRELIRRRIQVDPRALSDVDTDLQELATSAKGVG